MHYPPTIECSIVRYFFIGPTAICMPLLTSVTPHIIRYHIHTYHINMVIGTLAILKNSSVLKYMWDLVQQRDGPLCLTHNR